MLRKFKKKILFILITMMTSILLIGCSGSSKPGSSLKEITPVPVTVEGVEFKVGESKVGEILDGGLLISPKTTFTEGIDGLQLEKMTYYIAFINKDGYNLGTITFVNNTEESLNYRDCTISEYEMKLTDQVPQNEKYKYDNILVYGINFNGMMIDNVKNAMSGKTDKVSEFNNPDGSVGILQYNVNNVNVSTTFDYTTKIVNQVNVLVSNTYFE